MTDDNTVDKAGIFGTVYMAFLSIAVGIDITSIDILLVNYMSLIEVAFLPSCNVLVIFFPPSPTPADDLATSARTIDSITDLHQSQHSA